MNNNHEPERHKSADSVKWLLTLAAFAVVGVMLAGIILGWFEKKEDEPVLPAAQAGVTDGEGNAMDNESAVYTMPKKMAFSAERLIAALAAGQSVDVKITASVSPSDAVDTSVDFSVAWGAAPTNGQSDVSEFLTVTPDFDGSATATVSCKKAFGGDQIIITVITRDGGYSDTCTVTFVGKASAMSITHDSLTLKSTTERGTYYELGTNKSYDFKLNLSNVFNQVGSYNFSTELSASGSLYFCKAVESSDGSSVSYSEITSHTLDSMKDKFITSVSVSGTTLSITTGKTYIENYYSSRDVDWTSSCTITRDKYVCWYDESLLWYRLSEDYKAKAAENKANLPKCYFSVKVTDSVSGLSQTIKLWVVTSVSGVRFADKTLAF